MLERSAYRILISTRSAGRGRIVSVYYSPLNLRHELDLRGVTTKFFHGTLKLSRADALAEAARLIAELKADDSERLKPSL